MKRIIFLLTGLLFSFHSFSQDTSVQDIPVMDIVKKKAVKLYFDDYCSDVDFIQLRSVEKSAIGIVVKLEVDNKHIYVLDHTKALTIYNLDGSFLTRLQSSGNGPGEFAHMGVFHLMPERGEIVIYDDAQRKLLFYSPKGEFVREHKFNFSIDGISNLDSRTLLLFSDGKYNITDTPGHILYFIDLEKMEVIRKLQFLTSQQLESSVSYIRPIIAKDNNDIILQIPFCDTLFQIKKDSYSPKYILKLKNTGLKPEMMKSQELRRDVARFTTQFSTPYETNKFLLFRVDYKGDPKIIIQDKSTNTWELLDAPLNKKPGFRVRGVDEVSFTPMFCTDDYYYSFIDAIDFKEYFSEIYPDIVKSINDEDNPVVVRAKVK